MTVVGGTHERFRDRWRSLCHFAEAVVIAPDVQRLGIEHLHAHWAVGAATCAMVLSRLLDVPFTFTAHAYDIWLDRLLLPEKLRAADTIVTCTDYNRRHLIEAYGTPAEKLRIAWGLACLQQADADADPPFLDWLNRHRQTPRTVDRFWGLVLTSALNETPDRIGLRYARKVFVDGFLRHPRGFEVELPTVPLGRLYGAELQDWLADYLEEALSQFGKSFEDFEEHL